jgi:homoserine dehydrogenase
VVLVPGYAAVCEDSGRIVLLGRGGSDLTAVFLAAELGVPSARLLKDVDGVYDVAPPARMSRRYPRLHWDRALQVAGPLVQAKAVEAAQLRGVVIEVAALGADRASIIGAQDGEPCAAAAPRPLRVALAGCGVVGGGVLQRLHAEPHRWQVTGVLVRDIAKPRDVAVPAELLTNDPEALLAARPDVLVDALSEGPAGAALIERALALGVHVVSANKQALALDLSGLHRRAAAAGVELAYSAAVGGGAPMLETIRRARGAGPIVGFEAVLNGTVNFMLDRLSHGAGFDAALAEARRAGFAEEDPSADLDGHDSAAKVRLLALEAFGARVEDAAVPRESLSRRAGVQNGGALKQIGRCRREPDGRVVAEVALTDVAADSLFSGLRGERNAIRVFGADGREWAARGRGAGRWPTAESVLGDLAELRRRLLGA